jgi:outer membrane protein insertion porin family
LRGADLQHGLLARLQVADVGGVAGPDGVNSDANNLRASVGVGVSWISPMGPLRLAVAKPIKKFDGDKIQNMQFQIGTNF